MALVALQASFSTEASRALSERCARFQNNPYLDRAVAFTHLPKAGGTSYQEVLLKEATHLKACNLHKLDRLTSTTDCDLLVGHANAAFELQGFEWQGNPNGSQSDSKVSQKDHPSSLLTGSGWESQNGSIQFQFRL